MIMTRQFSAVRLLAICVGASFGLGACGGNSSNTTSGCSSDADCDSGQACIVGQCQVVDDHSNGGTAGAGVGGNSSTHAGGSSHDEAGAAPADSAGAAGSDSAGAAGSDSDSDSAGAAGSDAVPEPTAGGHCAQQSDCDTEETCADEASLGYGGGLCLKACDETSCPANDVCIEFTPNDPTTSACMIACQSSADCPTGQVCQNVTETGPLFCFPLCQSDSDCPTLGTCDRYTGSCLPDPNAGPGGIDDPCATDADCKSELCIPPSSEFPGGACTALCSLSHDGCPAGSVCTANWSSAGDEGICYQACIEDTDCRAGYHCGDIGSPQKTVCEPAP